MRIRRVMLAVVLLGAVAYVAYLGVLYFSQGSILYPGTRNRVDAAAPRVGGAELIELPGSAGTTEALFLPATDGAASPRQPVVIFGHGNGEVIDYWVGALDGFRERGIGVLLVEYPGYGRSKGSPSEASIRIAMDAAYDRIAADPRVDRTRIFGFGQSLGGGAICLLARDRPLRALILESTFPSLDIFAAGYWAPSFLLRDHFRSIEVVSRFPGPILVIQGRDDRLIPWRQGQRLAEASPRAKFELYDCGHGCWDPEHLPFWRDAEPFLQEAQLWIKTPNGAGSPNGTESPNATGSL